MSTSSAPTSGFTIAGIGVQQPIVTTSTTTTVEGGNDIGNLTREVENNAENNTANNGNLTMEQV